MTHNQKENLGQLFDRIKGNIMGAAKLLQDNEARTLENFKFDNRGASDLDAKASELFDLVDSLTSEDYAKEDGQ